MRKLIYHAQYCLFMPHTIFSYADNEQLLRFIGYLIAGGVSVERLDNICRSLE